jgi:hypothetical protein
MSMFDKLELRVPQSGSYTPKFAEFYSDLAWEDAQRSLEGLPRRLRSTRYYESVVDLRPFGHKVILHNSARLAKEGNYKIEFVETGHMGFSQMVREVEEIFDVDPESLAVMRVDLAADVSGIPVPWFVEHCRVQYKRWIAGIGHIVDSPEYSEMGMKRVETFYLGKRPNVVRIYDKVAEYQYQYKKLLRSATPDAEVPRFEEVFGISPDTILTRVERQLAAGRVPPQLDTVKKLRTASSFNPFERLRIINGCEFEPQPSNYRSDVYERGIGVRQLIQEQGLQRARFALNEQSRGNADRILKRLSDFIPSNGYRLTAEELFERYQESVRRQLIA